MVQAPGGRQPIALRRRGAQHQPRRGARAQPPPALGVHVAQRQEQPQWGPWTRGFVRSLGYMNGGLLIKVAHALDAQFMQMSQSVAEPTSDCSPDRPTHRTTQRKLKPFL